MHEYAVADTMLWQLRRPGLEYTRASYSAIARLAGVCRDKAQKAIAKLIALKLFAKTKHRISVRWGWNKCFTASRQDTNVYTWSTEAAGPPVNQGITSQQASTALNRERASAQSALEAVRLRREQVLFRVGAGQGRANHAEDGRSDEAAKRPLP